MSEKLKFGIVRLSGMVICSREDVFCLFFLGGCLLVIVTVRWNSSTRCGTGITIQRLVVKVDGGTLSRILDGYTAAIIRPLYKEGPLMAKITGGPAHLKFNIYVRFT